MSKNKVPPEFEWIKPFEKAETLDGMEVVIMDYPVLQNSEWVVDTSFFRDLVPCSQLKKAFPLITLTLTRKQAQALLLQMQKLDGISRGFIEDEKFYREIEKQIEEKLK